ncbi:MAG: hypothetical protein RXR43_00705 [Sulfolobus sp.]
MDCEKEALKILDILFNSNLIHGRIVYEDEIKHLIFHEKTLCSERDIMNVLKIYLRSLGIVLLKGSFKNDNQVIKVFEDGSMLSEGIYSVEYDILNEGGWLEARIILYNDRVIIKFSDKSVEYKINKASVIKAIKDFAMSSSTKDDFMKKFISFLNDNNDETTIQWLKDFLSHKNSV